VAGEIVVEQTVGLRQRRGSGDAQFDDEPVLEDAPQPSILPLACGE
jgi:hypothetical protein